MKRFICLLCAALLAAMVFAGCGGSKKDVSARESVASEVKSKVESVADDIGENVTEAVSAVVSEVDRMADNGQISDGDGVIGNEPEEPTDETGYPLDETDAEPDGELVD